jgi:Fur family zinc uptake transcriptional regulator
MNNQEIVLSIIKQSKKNLTAYGIMEQFRGFKKVQPMTVYRSLDSLIKKGLIHKSNQTKTYLLCNHSHEGGHNAAIAICKKCGTSEELSPDLFANVLRKNSLNKYSFRRFELEISTLCVECV